MESNEQELMNLADTWRSAELKGDISYLGRVLAPDFVAIGPLGFMLNKEEWLQRHSSGDLKYSALNLNELKVNLYRDAAIMTGRQSQEATYKGQPVPVPGQFRTMLVWVRQEDNWMLGGVQLSAIAQAPPGAPPQR